MSAKKTNSNKSEKKHRSRRGDGTIYQLSTTGKWVAQLKINGKRKTIATGDLYEEVKAKLDKAKVELRENSYIEKDNKTIGAILEENLQNKELLNKVCESTILRDRNTANVILNDPISKMAVQKTTRHDIQNFLNNIAQRYSNSYMDKIYTHLSNVFKSAILDHLINENPFAIGAIIKPKSIKPDKVVDALTREEQALLVAKLKDPNYKDDYKTIILLLLYTGCRCGEILALERSDLDFKNKVIHINKTLTRDKHDRPILSNHTKTKAGMRDVPMSEDVKRLLQNNMNFKYLFTLPDGRFIATQTICSHFRKIAKDCGIRTTKRKRKGKNGTLINENTSTVTTHMLRHTFITRCVESGMPPKVLQTIVGHSDYRITADIYTTIDETYKNSEMEKVEEQLKASNLM